MENKRQASRVKFWPSGTQPLISFLDLKKIPDTVYHNLPSVIEDVSSRLKPWGAVTISNHL
jgi:hypothetical protein